MLSDAKIKSLKIENGKRHADRDGCRKWLASKLVPKVYGITKSDSAVSPSLIEKLLFKLEE